MPPYNLFLDPWMGYLPAPPLSIAHLKDYLKENGSDCDLLDLDILIIKDKKSLQEMLKIERKLKERDLKKYLQTKKSNQTIDKAAGILLNFIDYQNYDIFGFSLVERPSLKYALILAKKIKELKKRAAVVLGGRLTIFLKGFNLEGVADLIVQGSGEEKLLEFCQNYPKNLRKTPKITPLVEKPEITLAHKPDYNAIPRLYKNIPQNFGFHNRFKNAVIPYIYSYGCPYSRCTFCRQSKEPRLRKTAVEKPGEKIIQDLKHLKKQYQTSFFNLHNEHLYFNYFNFKKLCRSLIKEGLNLTFWGCIRPNLPLEIIPEMKKAGFKVLSLGIESGSNRILKLMKKGATKEYTQRLLNELSKNKIYLNAYLIVGFPGESKNDFKETFRFVQKNVQKISQISPQIFKLEDCYIRSHPREFNIKIRKSAPLPTSGNQMWFYDEIGGRTFEELSFENYKNFCILGQLFYLYKEISSRFLRASFNEILYLMRKYNNSLLVEKEMKKLYEEFLKRNAFYLKINKRGIPGIPPTLEERWSMRAYNFGKILNLISKRAVKKQNLILTGEPTSFEKLPQVIEFAKKAGFKEISLYSSGQKFSSLSYCRQLKKAGLNHLIVYLYGHRASLHDKITRIPGSFKKMRQAILNWKSFGGVEIRPVPHSLNEKYLYEILDFQFKLLPINFKKLVEEKLLARR